MHKSFKYLAMTALASALIAGQATTAFAFKNDSNNGPGAAKTNEVSLQAPSDTSDNSQASGNNDSQTAITEDSSQPAGNSQSETSQTTENASNTTTENTTAAETVTEDTSARFRPIRHFYRYSFFVLLIQHGAIRSMMTLFFL